MRCEDISYKAKDGSLIIYYNGEFRGAIESTSMSVSIIDELLSKIEELEKQVEFLLNIPKDAVWETLINDSTRQYKTINKPKEE